MGLDFVIRPKGWIVDERCCCDHWKISHDLVDPFLLETHGNLSLMSQECGAFPGLNDGTVWTGNAESVETARGVYCSQDSSFPISGRLSPPFLYIAV